MSELLHIAQDVHPKLFGLALCILLCFSGSLKFLIIILKDYRCLVIALVIHSMFIFPVHPLASFEECPHQREEILYIVSILGG